MSAQKRQQKTQMSLSDLSQMLTDASPEERAEFAKNIPVETQREMTRQELREKIRREARSRQTTEMAQMVVLQHGSAIHPPGFEPKPPEWVSEMGEEAKQRWLDDWYAGKAPRTMEMFRREWGDTNANAIDKQEVQLIASTDHPESVLVGGATGAGGDQYSYLSMATPAPENPEA
jgi:hypothetical protein